MRGAWIEIRDYVTALEKSPSLPMRGAWIEIIKVISKQFTN